jgi:hypothetical protein
MAMMTAAPAHGTITGAFGGGGFNYFPGAFYVGPDSFSYRATNQIGEQSLAAVVSLTVLDHADAEFDGGSSNTLALDFGALSANTGTYSLQYRVVNSFAAYRAELDLDSLSEMGDNSNPSSGIFSTTATISNLGPGAFSSFFDVFVDTTGVTAGPYSAHYQFSLHDAHQYDLVGGTAQLLDLFVTAQVQVPEPNTAVLAVVGATGVGFAVLCRRSRKLRKR